MNYLFETSLIASFLGGILALFAPCCVTFMLPSYLASAFRQKQAIVLMTFVFFFGVATILVPISVGIAFLSSLFKSYHREVFYLAGIFLLALGILALSGKSLRLPFHFGIPVLKKKDWLSVYLLGVFSGLASSCCAPVLAGILTFSAISSNMLQALVLSLIYVFGMVFPLFLMAYFWDRFRLGENPLLKIITARLKFSADRIAGMIFSISGIYVLYLAATNTITSVSPSQTQLLANLTIVQKKILKSASGIPEGVFLLIFFTVIIFLLKKSRTR